MYQDLTVTSRFLYIPIVYYNLSLKESSCKSLSEIQSLFVGTNSYKAVLNKQGMLNKTV